MSQRRGFDAAKPENKKEKLTAELMEKLFQTTKDFMVANYSGDLTNESMIVLMDASIAYSGTSIEIIVEELSKHNKEIAFSFADEAKVLFNCYIERIKQEQVVKCE